MFAWFAHALPICHDVRMHLPRVGLGAGLVAQSAGSCAMAMVMAMANATALHRDASRV